jgi:branched-chain amino acid transport system permease protein
MIRLLALTGWRRSVIGGLIAALPVLVVGAFVLFFAPAYVERLAYAGLVAIVVVAGLQVFTGNALIVNFGHTVWVALGAYFVAILTTPPAMKALIIPNAPWGLATLQLHPLPAVILALLAILVLATLTGLVISRVSGIGADILTLCLQIVVHSVLIHWTDLFKGNTAFYGVPQFMTLPWALLIVTVVLVLARLFRDSPWGVQLRASSQNLLAARSMGVSVARRRLAAWVLGALISAAAGMMYVFFIGTISARSFYFSYVFLTIAMLILGGMRTVSGVVVGTAIIQIAIELIQMLENGLVLSGLQLPQMFGLSGLVLGVVIVLCMVLRPAGVMGTREFDDLLRARLVRRSGQNGERR